MSKLEIVDISKEVDIQKTVSVNRPLILNFNTSNIRSVWGKYTDLDISVQYDRFFCSELRVQG